MLTQMSIHQQYFFSNYMLPQTSH